MRECACAGVNDFEKGTMRTLGEAEETTRAATIGSDPRVGSTGKERKTEDGRKKPSKNE